MPSTSQTTTKACSRTTTHPNPCKTNGTFSQPNFYNISVYDAASLNTLLPVY